MSSFSIALITLGFTVGGFLFGMLLRVRLPQHHLKDDSRDVVKSATGMIATLVALVIGLLVSSAKSSFDAVSTGLNQMGAKFSELDRRLARYGPETKPIRDYQHQSLATAIEKIWPKTNHKPVVMPTEDGGVTMEDLHDKISALTPMNDAQKERKADALQITNDLLQTRWLLVEQSQNDLPDAFVVILIFWLTVLFAGFGLLAPWNITSVFALLICSVSMAGAVFLILEMTTPLEGYIKVSSTPLVKALHTMGK